MATEQLRVGPRTLVSRLRSVVVRSESAAVVVRNGTSNGDAIIIVASPGFVQIQVGIGPYDGFVRIQCGRNGSRKEGRRKLDIGALVEVVRKGFRGFVQIVRRGSVRGSFRMHADHELGAGQSRKRRTVLIVVQVRKGRRNRAIRRRIGPKRVVVMHDVAVRRIDIENERPSSAERRHVAIRLEGGIAAGAVRIDRIRAARRSGRNRFDGLAVRRIGSCGSFDSRRPVYKGSGEVGSGTRFGTEKPGRVASRSVGRGEIPADDRRLGRRSYRSSLKIRSHALLAVRSGGHEVRSGGHEGRSVVRGFGGIGNESRGSGKYAQSAARKSRGGNAELVRIELQLLEVGFSCGVIGIRRSRSDVSSREGDGNPVYVNESSGKGIVRIVDDVVPRRLVGNRRFRRNRRLQRPDVRLDGGVFCVLRVTRKRQEPYGSENRQDRDDDDEFDQGEAGDFANSGKAGLLHGGLA